MSDDTLATGAAEARDPDGAKPDSRLQWVPLVALPEEIEATLAAGFLQSEGVQCVVESRNFSQEPTNLSLLGQYILFVHEDQLDRARSLLQDRLELPLDAADSPTLDALLANEAEDAGDEQEDEE